MITRKFQDLELSMLGFGAMRLPTVDGNDAVIDEAQAAAMVDEAYRAGVNYWRVVDVMLKNVALVLDGNLPTHVVDRELGY